MNPPGRTSIIVRCRPEDAARMRYQASSEHRSLSGYLLHVLDRSISTKDKHFPRFDEGFLVDQARTTLYAGRKGIRSGVHLRCSVEQAPRIRRYAERRQLNIGDFVVFSLRRVWGASEWLQQS